MSETAKFYTKEQKDILKEYSDSKNAKSIPITESTGAKILDALGEQQNTLQNIESILQRISEALTAEKQHEYIKTAVSHALLGDNKYNSTL